MKNKKSEAEQVVEAITITVCYPLMGNWQKTEERIEKAVGKPFDTKVTWGSGAGFAFRKICWNFFRKETKMSRQAKSTEAFHNKIARVVKNIKSLGIKGLLISSNNFVY